jgi:exodeoxyribonuclease III
VYVPNGQAPGTDKFAYKLEWLARLARWAAPAAGASAPFALFGDFNVAPAPLDVHDPAVWEGQIHFTMDERNALAAVCAAGLCDVVRELNPEQPLFTWWDYRQLAFPKNKGLRIDHVLANSALRARVKSAVVDRDERKGEKPSDHAPVVIEVAD